MDHTMKLTELEPQFYRYDTRLEFVRQIKAGVDLIKGNWTEGEIEEVKKPVRYRVPVDSVADAQCVRFLCPKCYSVNGGAIGTHGVEVTFADRGVKDDDGMHNDQGQPVRWMVSGNGYMDLTTSPSVLILGLCGWHGFITNGEVSII